MKFRPETTGQYSSDNAGHWAVFWEVADLRIVGSEDGFPISDLHSFRSQKPLKQGFRPQGPMLVENPFT